MKLFLKFVVPALALGVITGSILRAQDQATPPPPAPAPPGNQLPPGGPGPGDGWRGRAGMMNPAQMVQRLDEALQLTDDQKAKITAISQKQTEAMQALRAKMQDLQKATHDEIRALLTADQQKKFDAMPPPGPGRGGRRDGGPGAPGGPGGDAPPPPAPAPAPAP